MRDEPTQEEERMKSFEMFNNVKLAPNTYKPIDYKRSVSID